MMKALLSVISTDGPETVYSEAPMLQIGSMYLRVINED